jgi:hypothetical protein
MRSKAAAAAAAAAAATTTTTTTAQMLDPNLHYMDPCTSNGCLSNCFFTGIRVPLLSS